MQYSYAAQKLQRYKLLKFIFWFIILFILYNCLTAFFISVWVVENNTMQPSFSSGERIIFSSFMMPAKSYETNLPFKRGSIVLVDMGNVKERSVPLRLIDSITRFFTAQKVSIFSGENQYYMKRVIALPGDEISMNNFVFRIKPAGNPYNLTEFELAHRPYHLSIPNIPALWDESIPLSGNMDTRILGPDECFVVSDDRANTNDSRTWGPVSPSLITGRALLRFWPILKLSAQ
jgi:signal peptidase I